MGLIWSLFIGLIVGALARFIMPGKQNMGWILTMVLGVVGALVATFLGRSMGWYQEGETAGFIASILGALLLLWIYGLVAKKKATVP
jgi:uncharacterized membrane protein YeaQ/YmgE (transglycosylase-associated protein family)